MIIQKNLDYETQKKIARLIELGKYRDYHEFVSIAIANQIQLDSTQESVDESAGLKADTGGFGVNAEPILGKDADTQAITEKVLNSDHAVPTPGKYSLMNQELLRCFGNPITENLTVKTESKANNDVQFEAYGAGASGLIWIFHNRMFPTKVALRVLANLMECEKKDSIQFDDWKSAAADFGMRLSNLLFNSGKNRDVISGLPIPTDKLNERFRGKRNRDSIVSQKAEATKKRFSEQFVGRLLRDDASDVNRTYCGACFEMGLVTNGIGGECDMIYLTESGRMFLELRNPVFDSLRTGTVGAGDIFSVDEVDFITSRIITRFKLENEIISYFLKKAASAPHGISKEEFSSIFKKSKMNYYNDRYSKNEYKDEFSRVVSSYEASEEYARQNSKRREDVMDWVVRRLDETRDTKGVQQNATIGRLVEMGLITKESMGRKIVYFLKNRRRSSPM